jgi:regulatory Fis family protein
MSLTWTPGMSLEAVEQEAIVVAYRFYSNNKMRTAKALGISVNTLVAKLEKYESDDADRKRREQTGRSKDEAFFDRQLGFSTNADGGILIDKPFPRRPHTPVEGQSVPSTASGVRVEPASVSPAQPPVPVHERQEVQKVLPRQAHSGSAGRNR